LRRGDFQRASKKYDEVIMLKLVNIEALFTDLGGFIDGVAGVHMSVLDLIRCGILTCVYILCHACLKMPSESIK
jgi:hypothetical protein